MIVINKGKFQEALLREGFSSIGELCSTLKIHRNSISRYLSGAPVLPKVIQAALDRLKLEPQDAFQKVKKESEINYISILSPIVGKVVTKFPNTAVMLFGSRAKSTAKRYSDFDLGIIGERPLSLSELSTLKQIVEEASEDLPYFIEVADLKRADSAFLDSIKKTAIFLGGNPNYILR